jgi:hypothetical protein
MTNFPTFFAANDEPLLGLTIGQRLNMPLPPGPTK